MKNTIVLLAFLFLCCYSKSYAQTFTNKNWVQTAGNPDALNLVSSALFPDGSVVIVGNTATVCTDGLLHAGQTSG